MGVESLDQGHCMEFCLGTTIDLSLRIYRRAYLCLLPHFLLFILSILFVLCLVFSSLQNAEEMRNLTQELKWKTDAV